MYTPGEYVGQDVFFFTVSVLVLILTPVLLAASELLPPNINIAANIIRAAITHTITISFLSGITTILVEPLIYPPHITHIYFDKIYEHSYINRTYIWYT